MNGYVSLDKLIDITSASIRDAFSLSKLPTIAIRKTNSSDIPVTEFMEVTSITNAQELFGINSDVAKFATKHFAVVSKNATKVDRMFVYNQADNNIAEAIKGAKVTNSVMQLNGQFGISLNGVVENFTVDLTSSTTFSDVASIIQTQLNTSESPALENATFTYNAEFGCFILKLSDADDEYNVEFVAGTLNDIHNKLGMTLYEGAKFYPQMTATDFDGALNRIKVVNGAYYLVTTLFAFPQNVELETIKKAGEWVHSSNNRFAFLYSWANAQLLDASSDATDILKALMV